MSNQSTYIFALLDPRPVAAARIANDNVFALGPVYGVEVTVPELAARCVINIDPEHTEGRTDYTAIESATDVSLPPPGAIIATVRPDLDSVGAMAILAIRRWMGDELRNDLWMRLDMIAEADAFQRGWWPGPRALPSKADLWPSGAASADDVRDLAPVAAAVNDYRLSLDLRVQIVDRWLTSGHEPDGYRALVDAERLRMVAALESGEIGVMVHGSSVVSVECSNRGATMIGYCLAPVVVARNPSFSFGVGPEHVKYTICAFAPGHCDIAAATRELAELEPGWGGSPLIAGSPQGVSSALTLDQVVNVVRGHLGGAA